MADDTKQLEQRQPTWAHCPGCGGTYALRKTGGLRQHRDRSRFGDGEVVTRPCPWSGRPPHEHDTIGEHRLGQLLAKADAAARLCRAREHRRLARLAARLRQRADAAQADLDAFELKLRRRGEL
jgi:hypothetical protein